MYLKQTPQRSPPPQQTNAFKMYVKKGWYGLSIILLLLVMVVISCNRQIQQKPDLSSNDKPSKTENKQIGTSDEQQKSTTLSENHKPQYGTYFAKMSPEYAWLDTLTFENLVQNDWIEIKKYDRNRKTKETLDYWQAYFNKTFADKLPNIPIDSFMIYTAHWYGVNNDFTFKYFHTGNSSLHQYRQYFKGRKIKGHGTKITFNEKGKPTRLFLKVARDLHIALSKKSFPYDSLYVLASDSLRDRDGLTLGEYNDRWRATGKMEGTPEYDKQNPTNKYNSKNHFDEIMLHNDQYYHVYYVKVYADQNNYQFFFDANNYRLLDFINTKHYCFNNLCGNVDDRKELDNDLEIYYYGNQGDPVVQPAGTYVSRENENLGNIASTQSLKVLTCDTDDNDISDNTEWKTLSLLGQTGNGTLQLNYFVAPDPPTHCWDNSPFKLYNTYYFSLYKSHQFFSNFNNSFIQSPTGSNEVRLTIYNQAAQGNNAASAFSLDDSFYGIDLGTGNNGNSPFATLDIVGHEYMHGIIESERMENFEVSGESYALLEGFCDIFGFMVERAHTGANDYVIMNHARVDQNRNMANPFSSMNQGILTPQPLYYQGRFWNTNDDGHHRCGVLNYWFYVLTNSGNYYPDKCNESAGLPASTVGANQCQPIYIKGMDIDEAATIVFEAMKVISADATFVEFRNEVLDATFAKYNRNNFFNICSNEFSQVYRAFQAVGLISDEMPYNTLNCNVISYDEVFFGECPNFNSANEFVCSELDDDSSQFNLNFPTTMLSTGQYYIQVYIDPDETGDFQYEWNLSVDGALIAQDLSGFAIPPFTVPNSTTPVQLTIYEVSNANAEDSEDDISLPFERYVFSCEDQCDFIDADDADSPNNSPNQGQVNTTLNTNTFNICPTTEICFDYTSTGPAQTFVDISGDQFAQLITGITSTSQTGTFCWTPNEEDIGIHNFQITATDGHPTQPITQTKNVTVTVVDYASDVWVTAGPTANPTKESGPGANDGSITIYLGSIYTLEFHWNGPGIGNTITYSDGPNGNTLTGLGNGTYTIDVYIEGTDCLYESYGASVGIEPSGGTVCPIQDLLHMRAAPAIFNDETIIEIEVIQEPLLVNLSAHTIQGVPVQNLVTGQVLDIGTHQVPFDGSADPNGLYIFQLAATPSSCRSGEQETISIKGFKF